MKTTKMSLANIQGKLSRAEMKNINGGAMRIACAVCSPVDTVCVSYNDATTHCVDSDYGSVFCVKISTGEQTLHACEMDAP